MDYNLCDKVYEHFGGKLGGAAELIVKGSGDAGEAAATAALKTSGIGADTADIAIANAKTIAHSVVESSVKSTTETVAEVGAVVALKTTAEAGIEGGTIAGIKTSGTGVESGAAAGAKNSKTLYQATSDNVSYFWKIAKDNPILTTVGLTASGVAIYAGINGLSFEDATSDLVSKSADELTPIVASLAGAAGTVVGTGVGAVVEGGTEAVGGGINAFVSGLTGIPIEYMSYIWYAFGGIVFLLIIFRIYKFFR